MSEQHFNTQSGLPTSPTSRTSPTTPASAGSSFSSSGSPVEAEQFGRPHPVVNPFSDKPSMQWNPRRVLYTVFTCALTGGLAMLIWTKLRLVTGVPRTAYADPAEKPTQDAKQSTQHSNERRDASVDELGGP